MKKPFLLILSLGLFVAAGCSHSDEKTTTTVKPQSTPDAARLKADSERLQQATMNAATEREKVLQTANPSATRQPKADLSPRTVPPQSPNPNP